MLNLPGQPRAWAPGGAASRRARLLSVPAALLAAAAAVLLPATPAWADHVRDQQLWVLDAVHAPAAWPETEGRGVTVAVIDSGVNPSVSDLAGSVVTGPDLTGVHTLSSNPNWGTHGTWMAALIAGHGHGPGGASGIIGVAPLARILSIRVVTDTGDPGYQQYQQESDNRVQQALAAAIRYAAVHHAGVISMSLGYGAPSLPVRSALQFALDHGTVVVASAGNSGDRATAHTQRQAPYSFPADYPGVLGVGAVAQDGTTASFSSANLSVQVAAPGVMVPTQGRDGKYWYVNGTSPACALTAGVAALIKARYPGLAPALVDQAITASAAGRPRHGYDDQVGFGSVDAARALAMVQRLAHAPARHRGVATAAHFGGGSSAIPAAPVRPRSGAGLRLYGALAALFLAGAVLAGRRLTRSRRRPELAAAGPHAGLRPAGWQSGAPSAARPAPPLAAGTAGGAWPGTGPARDAGQSAAPWARPGGPGPGQWQGGTGGPGPGQWQGGTGGPGPGQWQGGTGGPGPGQWQGGNGGPSPGPGAGWPSGPAAGSWAPGNDSRDAATWPGHGSGPGVAPWPAGSDTGGAGSWPGGQGRGPGAAGAGPPEQGPGWDSWPFPDR